MSFHRPARLFFICVLLALVPVRFAGAGELSAASFQLLTAIMDNNVAQARAAPREDNGFVTYWPVRAEKGGELLAAGDPSAPIQYIDVRDMAEWAIRSAEQQVTGVYNTVGPAKHTTYGELVDAARAIPSKPPKVTWVPVKWLSARKDSEMWGQLLFWHFQGLGGLTRLKIDRALAAGLTTRPIGVTLADVLRWYRADPPEMQTGLITRHKKQRDGTWAATRATWPEYMERERAVLAEWHATNSA